MTDGAQLGSAIAEHAVDPVPRGDARGRRARRRARRDAQPDRARQLRTPRRRRQRAARAAARACAAGALAGDVAGVAQVPHRAGVPARRADRAALAELDTATQYGAVALFVERAHALDPRFRLGPDNVDSIIEVCRQLDGIPLAIELAAARVPLLGVQGLAERLDQRFNVLSGGARMKLRRHQTLRAALDWSYGLLSEEEQRVFRRLGVFAGGFTLELAQATGARRDHRPVAGAGRAGRPSTARSSSPTATRARATACSRPPARSRSRCWPRTASPRRSCAAMPRSCATCWHASCPTATSRTPSGRPGCGS